VQAQNISTSQTRHGGFFIGASKYHWYEYRAERGNVAKKKSIWQLPAAVLTQAAAVAPANLKLACERINNAQRSNRSRRLSPSAIVIAAIHLEDIITTSS
jgi:hypothetical protein